MKNIEKHPDFSSKNGYLFYQDVKLYDIATELGTPVGLFQECMIEKQVSKCRAVFNRVIQHQNYKGRFFYTYATKANYTKDTLLSALKTVDFLEFSSANDIKIAFYLLDKGLLSTTATILCNGIKNREYIDSILKLKRLGLNIIPIIDNTAELNMLAEAGVAMDVGVRLNLDSEIYKLFETHHKSRFGMRGKELTAALDTIKNSDTLSLAMLHFHANSCRNVLMYRKIVEKLAKEYYCKIKPSFPTLRFLNLGGSFPNPAFDDVVEKTLSDLFENLTELFKNQNIEHPDLVVEYGGYTVNSSSFNFYKIECVKNDKKNKWYIINSSIMNFIPDVWGLNKKLLILPLNLTDNEQIKVKLGGMTCDPDDYYGPIWLPKINDGETLYIGVFNVGGYQDIISGYGGVHHCLIQEPKKVSITISDGQYECTPLKAEQTFDDMLQKLGYEK